MKGVSKLLFPKENHGRQTQADIQESVILYWLCKSTNIDFRQHTRTSHLGGITGVFSVLFCFLSKRHTQHGAQHRAELISRVACFTD